MPAILRRNRPRCRRCQSPMKVIAVITEPEEVRKILRHLVKVGLGGAP